MNWSINHDVIHYISTSGENIDTSSLIAPGHSALLRKGEYEFTVQVDSTAGNSYIGTIKSIGPIQCLEVGGVNRGKTVLFKTMNIFRVYLDPEGKQSA